MGQAKQGYDDVTETVAPEVLHRARTSEIRDAASFIIETFEADGYKVTKVTIETACALRCELHADSEVEDQGNEYVNVGTGDKVDPAPRRCEWERQGRGGAFKTACGGDYLLSVGAMPPISCPHCGRWVTFEKGAD